VFFDLISLNEINQLLNNFFYINSRKFIPGIDGIYDRRKFNYTGIFDNQSQNLFIIRIDMIGVMLSIGSG
jgi:hypothetical protein